MERPDLLVVGKNTGVAHILFGHDVDRIRRMLEPTTIVRE